MSRNLPAWKILCIAGIVGLSVVGWASGRPAPMMHDGSVVIREIPGTKGILVLAHGGSLAWNENVTHALKDVGGEYPIVLHFGMGIQDASTLEESIRSLEALGVREILAVPLFVSSHSLIMRQLKFLLGLGDHSPFHTGLVPIRTDARITMTQALDDSPEVGEILYERLAEISVNEGRETVILVAHGPVRDDDNRIWLATIKSVVAQLEQEYDFRAIHFTTLRDDAEPQVREAAARSLRKLVAEASLEGEVLVVPLLISAGGIEAKIVAHLEGLEYRFVDKGLVPHPSIQHWVTRRIEAGF